MIADQHQFTNPYGFLMAAIASAVGLGNIILFPYRMLAFGEPGFIWLYVAAVAICVFPILALELRVGMVRRPGPIHALRSLDSNWGAASACAALLSTLLVMFTYVFLMSVTARYFFVVLGDIPSDVTRETIDWTWSRFESSHLTVWVLGVSMISIASWIVGSGLRDGVEAAARWFVLALLVILGMLIVNATALPGFWEAMHHVFGPPGKGWHRGFFLGAVQGFFSLSVGMGIMVTYAGYSFPSRSKSVTGRAIVRYAAILVAVDTAVSVVAAIVSQSVRLTVREIPTGDEMSLFRGGPQTLDRLAA